MIKRTRGVFIILISVIVAAAIFKNTALDTPENCKKKANSLIQSLKDPHIETYTYGTHKAYIYKIYYLSLLPIGELTIAIEKDGMGNEFSFEATSKGSFVDKALKAKARIASYSSGQGELPYKYTEKTEVKGKIKTKEIVFDQANLISIRGDRKFKIPMNTYDPVSAFVHMLTLPLAKGREQKINMVSGEELYILKATVVKEYPGIAEVSVDIRRENLTSSHGATFTVWVTADNARIPLLFKSWSPVGYASVVLDRVELQKDKKQ